MAEQVNFTVNLKINGKDALVEVGEDARHFAKELGVARSSAEKLGTYLVNFGQIQQSFQNLQNGLQSITGVLNNLTEESRSIGGAMKAANTMAGKDAAGFERLKGQVTELSKVIPLTRDELARGLYQVISNGVPEDNWIS